MGLSSAMTTALTGMHAAETQIDVAGNNLANSQTVGFKASEIAFASQFLQTLSQGSTPNENMGGTNPRQIGLGVQVAAITPDFTQGTIDISSSPSDLAIQGDGFFIVEGLQGEHHYTRDGIFKTNSAFELVSSTGHRLLGHTVDEYFNLQTGQLAPITIPLGVRVDAQPTQNAYLHGNLTPTGDLADTAEVIQTDALGDGTIPRAVAAGTSTGAAPVPDPTAGSSSTPGASAFNAGDQYEYVVTFTDGAGRETVASQAVPATVVNNSDNITLSTLPTSPHADFPNLNIYRREIGVPTGDPAGDLRLVQGNLPGGTATFVDTSLPAGGQLDDAALTGVYSYLVTYSGPGVTESRPSELLGPVSLTDGRVHLENLPNEPGYTTVNIYRNLASNSDQYHLVASVAPGSSYTDSLSDATIAANQELNMNGPAINDTTPLVDIVRRNGLEYEPLFDLGAYGTGELSYAGRKGGALLTEKTLQITDTTTVAEYLQFVTDASGIQSTSPGGSIPGSVNNIPGETGTLAPGRSVTSDGQLRLVSNNGTATAVSIPPGSFQLTLPDGTTSNPDLGFGSVQEAAGQSAVSDFIAYDSLGVPLDVRLTTVLEARDGQTTTYRWFADAGENDPTGPDGQIAVGTGLITFDGEGNFIQADNSTVNIQRGDIPSTTPLAFDLDFTQLSGFSTESSTLTTSRQDGSPFGTLTSYSMGEAGEITGIFNNGTTRTLGQIRMARFVNPTGLEQQGQNMFGVGLNSGDPMEGDPGQLGLGTLLAGALELSNTDTGENLIDLMLASTQYRANSRVISTSQQLLDDLLNMRR